MHQHNDDHGHIPPPDLPRHKTVLGFRPHIFVGGLVLIALLLVYLFLMVHRTVWVPTQPQPASTSSSIPSSNAPVA